MDILLLIVVWFIMLIMMAFSCSWMAGEKGRDKLTWGVLGLLLGPIALLLVATAPPKKTNSILPL